MRWRWCGARPRPSPSTGTTAGWSTLGAGGWCSTPTAKRCRPTAGTSSCRRSFGAPPARPCCCCCFCCGLVRGHAGFERVCAAGKEQTILPLPARSPPLRRVSVLQCLLVTSRHHGAALYLLRVLRRSRAHLRYGARASQAGQQWDAWGGWFGFIWSLSSFPAEPSHCLVPPSASHPLIPPHNPTCTHAACCRRAHGAAGGGAGRVPPRVRARLLLAPAPAPARHRCATLLPPHAWDCLLCLPACSPGSLEGGCLVPRRSALCSIYGGKPQP